VLLLCRHSKTCRPGSSLTSCCGGLSGCSLPSRCTTACAEEFEGPDRWLPPLDRAGTPESVKLRDFDGMWTKQLRHIDDSEVSEAFICVAHSAQGPAVRRLLCASAPAAARWLSRHAHYNLKHHPSVTGEGLDKATIGDRAFGKRLLSPVGSSALPKPRNVAYRVGSRVSTDGSSSPAHHTRPINSQNSSCVVVTHML